MPGVFGAASLPITACIALLAAAVLQILGFATPYWSHDGSYYLGLWRKGGCNLPGPMECYKLDHVEYFMEPWLKAVRGLESLGIIFLSVPLVVLPVYMYIALGMYYKSMMVTMCVSTLLAALTIIAGVIVYAVEITANNWDMEWSVFVCIAACGCSFIGFLVLAVAISNKRPPALKEVFVPTTIYVDPKKPQLYTVAVYE